MTPQTLRVSDDRRVRVLSAGSGPPLLLIHGVGLRAEAWGPQIAALSCDYSVFAVDLPGHGESDPLGVAPQLRDYVDWAAGVITALGLGPLAVAGHSMGALVAIGLAVDHPSLVARVALLNPVHRRSPTARAAVLARAAEIAVGQGDVDAPLDRWFTPDQHDLRVQVGDWLRAVPQAGYASAYRAFAEGDLAYADGLGRIQCPLLALTGSDDANSTPTMTQTIAAQAANGRAVILSGHRHMVNLTAPLSVTTAMQAWLAETQAAL